MRVRGLPGKMGKLRRARKLRMGMMYSVDCDVGKAVTVLRGFGPGGSLCRFPPWDNLAIHCRRLVSKVSVNGRRLRLFS